jgi:hypothetical protein
MTKSEILDEYPDFSLVLGGENEAEGIDRSTQRCRTKPLKRFVGFKCSRNHLAEARCE